MPAIEIHQRTVYRSPSSRRSFLTAKAAARSEAAMLIKRKYPTESPEYGDYGMMYYPGFHWSEDERLLRVHGRLVRIILRKLNGGQTGDAPRKLTPRLIHCAATQDGECSHAKCPQLRDNEPATSGRHCPLDIGDEDES